MSSNLILRLEIVEKFDMVGLASGKEAFRLLFGIDAPRCRTNSDSACGNSVYWNPKSVLQIAKVYTKGAQK